MPHAAPQLVRCYPRPLLAVYDNPNSNKGLHTRSAQDEAWKTFVGPEQKQLIEGSLEQAAGRLCDDAPR